VGAVDLATHRRTYLSTAFSWILFEASPPPTSQISFALTGVLETKPVIFDWSWKASIGTKQMKSESEKNLSWKCSYLADRLERCIGIIASLVRLLTTIGKHRWRLFSIWKPSQNNRSQWLSRNNRTDCDCDIENYRSLTMVVICRPLLLPKADVKQSNQRFWQI